MATSTTNVSGDDYLTGTDGADKIIAGGGSDTVDGGDGSDFINAGGGDDTIIYDENDYKILGGGGIDTLWFTGANQSLDLSWNVVTSIEKLLLGGDGGHQVTLTADDIVRVSDTDQMIITGDDTNHIDPGTGWTFAGLTADGKSEIFTHGLAKIVVSLPVIVEGYSANATFSVSGTTTVTEDASDPLLEEPIEITVIDQNTGQGILRDTIISTTGNLGTLAFTGTGPYVGTSNGEAVYQVDNAAVQYLGEHESATDTFTVMAIDGKTEDIVFTIEGVNDDPELVTGGTTSGSVSELAYDATGAGGTDVRSITGSFTVKDADIHDTLTLSNGDTQQGTWGSLHIDSVSESDAQGLRTVQWTYSYTDADLNSLTASDQVDDDFNVKFADPTGASVTRLISIDITGADEAPLTISISELEDGNPDENTKPLDGTGEFSAPNAVGVSVKGSASNIPNLGFLSVSPTEFGTMKCTFSVNDRYLNHLQGGETVTQSFEITVDYGSGKTETRTVLVNLEGQEDANTILDSAGDAFGNFTVTDQSDVIVRGLGADDYIAFSGESSFIYGDDGDDSIWLLSASDSLVRGGAGNDLFYLHAAPIKNEIYGDAGKDEFQIEALSENDIWGGPGSDRYEIRTYDYTGLHPVIHDFDFSSPSTGGDFIRFVGQDPNLMNLHLIQTGTDSFELKGTANSTELTFFILIGTNLTMDDLRDNISGYNAA